MWRDRTDQALESNPEGQDLKVGVAIASKTSGVRSRSNEQGCVNEDGERAVPTKWASRPAVAERTRFCYFVAVAFAAAAFFAAK